MPGRRIVRPQPKDKCSVPIPEELRAAFREIWETIQLAESDDSRNIDFDDAIQAPGIYGGKIAKGARPFIFTYSPFDDRERGRWFLHLARIEIEDIADGVIESLTLYCCTSSTCRCKFSDPSETCFYCDYAEDPDHGTWPVAEALPRLEKIGFHIAPEDMTFDELVRRLGDPIRTGAGTIIGNTPMRPWAKFRFGNRVLHFAFDTVDARATEVTF
jgi:hypothetical protein